jgi:hypothetical protein
MSGTAPQRHHMTTTEGRNFSVDYSPLLSASESLSGTPTLTPDSGDFVASNPQVNGAALLINGRTVAAGKAVIFHGVCAVAGEYRVKCQCDTDGSQTDLEGNIIVEVRETGT